MAWFVGFALFGCAPTQGPLPLEPPDPHWQVDLTEDLHHRILSGMFEPDSEPVLIQLHAQESDTSPQPAGGQRLDLNHPCGTLGIDANEAGLIVLHLDIEALCSHIVVEERTHRCAVSRSFLEYVPHPVVIQ